MKTLLIIFLTPFLSFSQEDTLPFKKCNTITVYYQGNRDSTFKAISESIQGKGIAIDGGLSQSYSIATQSIKSKNTGGEYKTLVFVSGNKVVISGQYQMLNWGWNRSDYRGMKNSIIMKSWEAMEAIAGLVNGKKQYSIQ